MTKLVKLNESGTVFSDPQTGFTLSKGEEKPWPENPGKLTRQWLNGGGLVMFEGLDDVQTEKEPGQEEMSVVEDHLVEQPEPPISVPEKKAAKPKGITNGRKR